MNAQMFPTKRQFQGNQMKKFYDEKVLFKDIVKRENAGSVTDSYHNQLTLHDYYEDKASSQGARKTRKV